MLTMLDKNIPRRATSFAGTATQSGANIPVRQAYELKVFLPRWNTWSPNQDWEIKWPVICQEYSVRDASAAGALTLEKTYLLDLLLQAYPKLAGLFGPGCEIKLDRASDPDVSERTYLLVTAMTTLPVNDALARMDRFTDEWWLDHIAEVGRYLVFMVDFI